MRKTLFLIFFVFTSFCLQAANMYCVLSGSTLTFYYDDEISARTGTKYDLVYSNGYPKWNGKASSVKNVVFDSSFANARPTDGSFWFHNMTNLTSINGMSFLNTSEMTTMAGMFYSCTSLELSTSAILTREMWKIWRQCSKIA